MISSNLSVSQISPTDHGPHKICNKCLNSVNSWFEFNEECKIANAVLQKFLSELSMKTKANEPVFMINIVILY